MTDCELEYEASDDDLDDQAYWAENVPLESESPYGLPTSIASQSKEYEPSAPVQLDPSLVPEMISGVVPLALKVSPESTVADSCEHVDKRIQEALKHQRLRARAIDDTARFQGSRQSSNRAVINFIPTTRLAILPVPPDRGP